MTAAGVQTNDSAAYLPPPPSTSTPDAKGTSAAGKPSTDPQAANAQRAPSDFQSELELQQSGARQSGAQQTGPQQTGPQQTESKASPKADPGKPGKKRDARTDNANPSAVTPVQVAEPQRPILPFSLALPQAQDLAQQQVNATPDQNAKANDKGTADENVQGAAQPPALVLSPSLASIAQLSELQQPATAKQSMKVRQSTQPEATPKQTAASNAIPATVTDSGKTPVLPFVPVPAVAQAIPERQEVKKSEDQATQEQNIVPVKSGASSGIQPLSPADLKLPAAPSAPVASGVQETLDRDPASPSALAFAARVSVAQQKPDQTGAAGSPQSPAVPGSQTAVEIPVRYAATAQIIQSATLRNEPGTQQDEPKKDAAFSDGPARPDARTDMVMPQFETVSQSAPNSGSTAPRQAAPAGRAESVIELPAAPPTSSHDIRVRVPDNNGGSTQVRFVESGGQVRVSVRTADDGLAQNLRTHLNDLTQRLSDGGMPAEIWKPASNAASSQNDQQQSHQDGRGSGGQGSGSQGGQQDREQQRPAWLEEMEASLHGEQG